MRVCVFGTCPNGVFSGGRYHALMVAQVLARRGHQCYFVTNNYPIFAQDLAPMSPGNPVAVVETKDFDVTAHSDFDAVVLAPQMGTYPRLYKNAIRYARDTGASLFLINYETPNWFNSLSPSIRPASKWREWNYLPNEGCMILCSAQESVRFAERYYQDLPPETRFGVWQPAINSVACDAAPGGEREKKIVLFARLHDKHKGGDDISELIDASFSGYTLSIVIGNPKDVERPLAAIEARCRPNGVAVEPLFALSDYEKFQLLKKASAVVFPSYFEGYGYPPIEALATDTPCVAYDLPVVRENCGDLIRYAPLGSVGVLRRELQAALAAGPQPTSSDPRARFLIDVDQRAEALEQTVRDYIDERAAGRSRAGSGAPQIELSRVSRIEDQDRASAFVLLASDRNVVAVEGPRDVVEGAAVHRGPWVDGRRHHGVFLTLARGVDDRRLRALTLTVRFEHGVSEVSLANAVTGAAQPAQALSGRCCAINKVACDRDTALLFGWAYPEQPYDSLYLIDAAGNSARLETAVKNLQSRSEYPADLEHYCGFIGSVDRSLLDLERLRLVYVEHGIVTGVASISASRAMDARTPAVLVGPTAAPDDRRERVPSSASSDASWTATPPVVSFTGNSLAEPLIRKVAAKDRPVVAARGAIAHARRLAGLVLGVARRRGRKLRWAVSQWDYDGETGEVVIRGWTSRPDTIRVEIWLADGKTVLGRATTGISRPDVSKELKNPDRDDFGFAFRAKCERNMMSGMRISLYENAKLIATRVYESVGVGGRPRFEVEGFHFDPTWNVLWMRGLFASSKLSPVRLDVLKNGKRITSGVLLHKVRPDGKEEVAWRVESVLDEPLTGRDVLVLEMSGAGAAQQLVFRVPEQAGARALALRRDERPRGNESLADLIEPDSERVKGHQHLVLMVVHNLNAAERPEKRRALEQLRAALNELGAEMVLLHHAKSGSGCALPEINYFNPKLAQMCERPGDPELWRSLDQDGTLQYCRQVLYGFEDARNRTPTPWDECSSQVRDEARRLEEVVRVTRPSLILLWHQWNSLMLLGRAIAERKGVGSAFVHEGMLPGTMTIDSEGMMAEAGCVGMRLAPAAEGRAALLERARHIIDEIRDKQLDRKPQFGAPAADQILDALRARGARTVFYAGINDWQSGNLPADHPRAKVHAPHFTDTEDALRGMLEAAHQQDFYLLYKPHPNLFPRESRIDDERLIYLREASTPTCIAKSDATATLLSSIAYISLAHGKPTVLLGRNTLSGLDAAYELQQRGDLARLVGQALDAADLPERLQRYHEHIAALLGSELFPYGDKTDFAVLTYRDAAERLLAILREGVGSPPVALRR